MKNKLSSYADETIEKGDLYDAEYRKRLTAWSDAFLAADAVLWDAVAEVLAAAIQFDLETPAWCRCRPGGEVLDNAIDTVLDALPPQGVRAFDKKQQA